MCIALRSSIKTKAPKERHICRTFGADCLNQDSGVYKYFVPAETKTDESANTRRYNKA